MSQLKLIALDEQDLEIVSAHVQDAVMRIGDLAFLAGQKRFVLPLNRFVWENKTGFIRKNNERRRSTLHFEAVRSVSSTGIPRDKPDDILSLLAIRFIHGGELPAGAVVLTFSGEAAIRLEVDYVEARLADLGPAWQAGSRPVHKE